jgi:NAD(P)-dependent dehydrogenase (short-subunit alcohol dehydrogenase family)
MPDQTLAGKVAIISGSNSGIGAAICRELSSRGALCIINYPFISLREEGERLAASLPTKSIAVEADLSKVDGPKKLVDGAVKAFGKVDILVNNAGLAVSKQFEQQDLDDWDLLVNLNGRGTFLLTKKFLQHLPKDEPVGFGRIVNIVSISAREAPALQTIYSGTKGMVDSFTKVWAKELPPKYPGLTVNAVSPGPTMTDGFAAAGEEFIEKLAPVLERTPAGNRLGKPEEIAFGVAFLCDPRASWVNGTHLIIDGGLFMD